ncbi:DeoR/GlpR family DNA-binding transcription regulator [Anaeromassilibacillus senegalensis]|uniref:DeoR/GlpR family DNA-binding transcription regulator n=1 Tax=Anaeromassilibacillus senegalensis TaxID=1673717 RepID=UPI00068320B1|nr:DeoR/GlpR family DNA-binding transcription regulator [Anaeromassilibacillus senegalensis]
MTGRHTNILELLTERQKMEVTQLAELLGVSQVTVRKDLDQLEAKGLVRRVHGCAVIGSSDDLNNRLAYHYDSKKKIAQAAAADVRDGETVMIESGSCCALLAEELASKKRDITIVTNSAFIAGYIRTAPHARVILLGGEYQPESQVLVGPVARKCAQEFFVDKLFIGTDGFHEQSGFTAGNLMRAETVKAMAEQANQVIILTESEKFSQQGVVSLLRLEQVSRVVTDDGIPESAEQALVSHGIEVHKISIG